MPAEANDRELLRQTFNRAAAQYQEARPEYPRELFDWEIRYTAESYIRLLDTFSGHIAMADWQRDRLYGEIRRRLADRPDGELRRHWGAMLHVARKI